MGGAQLRGHLQAGETVLVLGAGGSAGQLAVQSARVLRRRRVVGAARGKALGQAADRGANAVVDLADDQAIDAGLAAAAPGGYDVILDFLWGPLAPFAMNHANVGARYIQVGNSAGPTSTITAATIRNKLLTLVGHGPAATPAEVRRSAYAQLMRHAVDGKITWTWSKHGWMTSARPGSTSRPAHRANSWSHPEPSPAHAGTQITGTR